MRSTIFFQVQDDESDPDEVDHVLFLSYNCTSKLYILKDSSKQQQQQQQQSPLGSDDGGVWCGDGGGGSLDPRDPEFRRKEDPAAAPGRQQPGALIEVLKKAKKNCFM